MRTQMMLVTPELATKWLQNNPSNRPIRYARVKQYADDMKCGAWLTTHQGIAFYIDGALADGQHRLRAIEVAGVTVPMMVTNGLPRDHAAAIDAGKPREVSDTLHIILGEKWVTKEVVAITRLAITKFERSAYSISAHVIQDYMLRHQDLLQKVCALAPTKKRRLTTSHVLVTYFCALANGVPHHQLARFAQIITTGEIAGRHENAAIRVRELLLNSKFEKEELVRRIQKGIQMFCAGQSVQRLNDPQTFIYPIPE
jgi:hypothetical protein